MILCVVRAESLAEAALCKSVLKPLREPIYEHLEKLHTSDGSLKQLAQNQVGQYGVTPAGPTAPRVLYSQQHLQQQRL